MAMNMQSSDPTAAGAAQMAQPGAGASGAGGQGSGGPQQIVIQAVGDGTYTLTVDGQPGQQPMQPQDLCDAVEEVLGVAEQGEGGENEGTEPNAQAMWDQEADKAQKTRAMQASY